ncbi:protein DROOPING LEAF-like [Musa acuminata AAA Group]|uniref:protein DROOPING LEAF-like n=2 Tax=Musa acuminata AAA Group TaxID=214697 RepID=UPI0005125413|nr:PREDICTED: protein DROOPING LEAF-like [Musa acuminata subsp. malaccensis]
MDLVSPAEHLCYIRCTYCNTLLAVGVPRRWLMDSVTVHCGHCNHLSFLNPRDVIQCLCPAVPQMGFQVHFPGPCTGLMMEPPSLRSSSSVPKKHRAPSAYNHFMREEIQRIKAAKPDIPHREAFSMAAKNWAKCDPRNSANVSL